MSRRVRELSLSSRLLLVLHRLYYMYPKSDGNDTQITVLTVFSFHMNERLSFKDVRCSRRLVLCRARAACYAIATA